MLSFLSFTGMLEEVHIFTFGSYLLYKYLIKNRYQMVLRQVLLFPVYSQNVLQFNT